MAAVDGGVPAVPERAAGSGDAAAVLPGVAALADGGVPERAADAGVPSEAAMREALEMRYGSELLRRFSGATVAVCGLGGLGSNIAVALARAGVGTLHLIDFDTVDTANLNRQQYFASQIGMYKTEALRDLLRNISPYITVAVDTVRITAQNLAALLKDADVVCEAFDRAEEKAMLVNGVREQLPETYLVCGSGLAGLSSANSIRTRRAGNRFYICGDEQSDVAGGIGLVSSRVMVCAAHQAHMTLRILSGEYGV